MLGWWRRARVDRVDLAVKRSAESMVWHHDLQTNALPLGWMRAENVRRAEVYIRPARHYEWPLVFLDDVPTPMARAVARKYDALLVKTSSAGGCHVWLTCSRPLDELGRYRAQRWLAGQIDSDLGSVSGEHLGRLAGFKNWKRAGIWVNVLNSSLQGRPWLPVLPESSHTSGHPDSSRATDDPHLSRSSDRDCSDSGREWGWVCGALEAGLDPASVEQRLAERAKERRGKDLDRYVQATLSNALRHISKRRSLMGP